MLKKIQRVIYYRDYFSRSVGWEMRLMETNPEVILKDNQQQLHFKNKQF